MKDLLYFTRSGDLPTDKIKILLLSSPRDKSEVRATVAADILKKLDAAVYYFRDGIGDFTSELLSDINLVVVAVTNALLNDFDDTAHLLAVAKESKLPVIPILFEVVNISAFESRFGSMQFLDRAGGSAFVDYSYKLSDRLRAFDVNRELYDKIASSFDATVFLSYRHIDRPHANRLMRMLHDHDSMRDVAVWYDDQLTPGENYNDEILASLRACDAMLLVVTPHLLDTGNYVLVREYPEARLASIPVIPALAAETPFEALAQDYEGIDAPESYDNALLRLESLLANKLNQANNTDPVHLFYIAMAYKLGIGVEVDFNRALQLFNMSADLGEPRSIEALVNIYCYGDTADLALALEFSARLTDYYEQAYKESGLEADLSRLVLASEKQEQILRQINDEFNSDFLLRYFNHSLELFNCSPCKYYECLITAALNVVHFYQKNGQSSRADSILSELLKLMWELYKSYPIEDVLFSLVGVLLQVANLHSDGGVRETELALSLLDGAADRFPYENRKIRELAADAYFTLGRMCVRRDSYEDALTAYKKARELYLELSENELGVHNLYYYNLCEIRLADVYINLGSFEKAEEMIFALESLDFSHFGESLARCMKFEINDLNILLEIRRKRYPLAEKHLKLALLEAESEDMRFYRTITYLRAQTLYRDWKKPQLCDLYLAKELDLTTASVRARGAEADFNELSSLYSRISLGCRVNNYGSLNRNIALVQNRYANIFRDSSTAAAAGRVELYPDESHIQVQRKSHIHGLVRGELFRILGLLSVIAVLLLENKLVGYLSWSVIFSAPAWFKLLGALIIVAGFLTRPVLYFLLYRDGKRGYDPWRVFDYVMRSVAVLEKIEKILLVAVLLPLVCCLLNLEIALTFDFSLMSPVVQISLAEMMIFWLFDRFASVYVSALVRERNHALYVISGLKPTRKGD